MNGGAPADGAGAVALFTSFAPADTASGLAFGLLFSAVAAISLCSCWLILVPSAWARTARSSSRANHRASAGAPGDTTINRCRQGQSERRTREAPRRTLQFIV